MRGGNSMKNPIMVGLIAGFLSGISMFISSISGLYDLFSVLPVIFPVYMHTIALVNIIQGTIWGVIFGAFYALVYDYIPGKGVKKGLVYGLIIWIIVIIRPAFIGVVHGYYRWAIPWTIVGFFSVAITYGLLIGFFYKKE